MPRKTKRHTVEQIIGILRETETCGKPIQEFVREKGVREQTFYRWRSKYGGMDVEDSRRLKEFEQENLRLMKLVAVASLLVALSFSCFGCGSTIRPRASNATPDGGRQVPGTLSDGQLRTAIRSGLVSSRECLPLLREPGHESTKKYELVFDLEVAVDGSVMQAALVGPQELAGTAGAACINADSSRWRFPPSAHGATVKGFHFGAIVVGRIGTDKRPAFEWPSRRNSQE